MTCLLYMSNFCHAENTYNLTNGDDSKDYPLYKKNHTKKKTTVNKSVVLSKIYLIYYSFNEKEKNPTEGFYILLFSFSEQEVEEEQEFSISISTTILLLSIELLFPLTFNNLIT